MITACAAHASSLDVTDGEAVEVFFDRWGAEMGGLDASIHTAAILERGALTETSDSQFAAAPVLIAAMPEKVSYVDEGGRAVQ